jgi:hypothetical protein
MSNAGVLANGFMILFTDSPTITAQRSAAEAVTLLIFVFVNPGQPDIADASLGHLKNVILAGSPPARARNTPLHDTT